MAPIAQSIKPGTWVLIALVAITLAGAAIRLYRIQDESVWYDESVSYYPLENGATSLSEFFMQEREHDPPMVPLYFTIQYYWCKVFGATQTTARLLSLLFGVACIPMIFLLGREFRGGGRTGLMAAGLYCLSINATYYAQEIRMYSLFALLVLVSMWSLVVFLRTADRALFHVNLAANLLLPWTHVFAVFFLAIEAIVFAAAYRKDKRKLLFWFGAQAVNAALWYALWLRTIDQVVLNRAAGWTSSAPRTLNVLLKGYVETLGGSWRGGVNTVLGVPMSIVIGVLFMLLLVLYAWRNARRIDLPQLLLVLVALAPIAVFAASFVRYMFGARYTLYCAAPIYIMGAAGIMSVQNAPCRRLLACAVFIIMAAQAAMEPRPWRPDWNAVMAAISENPDARFVVTPKYERMPLLMKYKDPQVPGLLTLDDAKDFIAKEAAAPHAAFWFINVLPLPAGPYPTPPQLSALLKDHGFDISERILGAHMRWQHFHLIFARKKVDGRTL
jgi:uncharacterized membrane protein